MEGIAKYSNTGASPFARDMRYEIVMIDEMHAVAEFEASKPLTNYMDIMHGGASYTMADIFAGTVAGYHQRVVTASSEAKFLRPIYRGKIQGEAEILKIGKTQIQIEVRFLQKDKICFVALFDMAKIDDSRIESGQFK